MEEISCPICKKEFGIFLWRHECRMCHRSYCDDCAPSSAENKRVCKYCRIFILAQNGALGKLLELPVGLLNDFAASKKMNLSVCIEKEDLAKMIVSTILMSQPLPPRPPPPTNQSHFHTSNPYPGNNPSHYQPSVRGYPNTYPPPHSMYPNPTFTQPFYSPGQPPSHPNTYPPPHPGYSTHTQSPPFRSPSQPPSQSNTYPPSHPGYSSYTQSPPFRSPSQPPPQSNTTTNKNEYLNLKSRDIDKMRVAELQKVLQKFKVDYSDCIEKEELVNKVKAIFSEATKDDSPQEQNKDNIDKEKDKNENTENTENTESNDLCIICFDNTISTVFLECGHMATCKYCAVELSTCPICREPISRVVNVYHATK